MLIKERIHTSCLLVALAVGSLALAGPAELQGQEGFRPVAVDRDAGLPDTGFEAAESFLGRLMFDSAAPRPAHPPIDQIPPMPMPERLSSPGIEPADIDNRVIFHDSETGFTQISDYQMPSGLLGGESIEGDYRGVMPYDDVQSPAGFGTMAPAGNLDTWPRSGNVKLIMRFTDTSGIQRWFACSGSMQDSGVVLTAAHCVYARTPGGLIINDWADIVYIYPAWDGASNNGPFGSPDSDEVIQNFGYAFGTSFVAGADYINFGNMDRDCGAIGITRGSSRNVGMLTGWFSWAWGGSCGDIQSRWYNNFSYPAENCPTAGLHTGTTMYHWNGTVDACPFLSNQMELHTGGGNCLDTVWGGMSGSGMYYMNNDNRYVHSVCSTSNRFDRGWYCMLWESFITTLQTFENGTRSPVVDWEPLMMRARGSTTVQAGTTMDDSFDVKMINATNGNPGVQDYQLKVYMSTNNNISTGDTLLGTWNWNGRDFGAMNNVNFVVPAPAIPADTPAGTYWIGVIADSGLSGTTSNDDTDTWDAQQITVTLGLPTRATIVSPSNSATDVDIRADLDWIAGTRATSSSLYFGTDSTPDAGEYIGVTTGSSWALPTLAYNTAYYWRVDSINSAGTTTGTVWSFSTETEPVPDLRAASCDYDTIPTYYAGQTISNVLHRTYNDGSASASGFHLDFYVSTNNFISTLDTLMGTLDYGVLDPGENRYISSSFTLPASLSPRTYFLGFIASDTGGLETNFTNNWVAGTSPITIVAPCPPDLNFDGALDFFDVSDFLLFYSNGDPAADFDGNGDLDFFDVSDFLLAFGIGCP